MPELVTVVLVDDSSDVRSLLRARLRLAKRFEVVGEGGTGADAIRLVTELDPDLLVLDVSMPDMDGLDALGQVREAAPRTCTVMFSGFEEHGLADRARALGAADFVEKSIPIDQLADRLLAAVGVAGGSATTGSSGKGDGVEPVLQEHLERFRAAFDQAAIGMATLTLTGRIVRANPALEHVVGVGDGALVGVPYESLVEASADEVAKAFAVVASGDRDADSVEHPLQGGSTAVSTVAVVRDAQRRPLYLFLQVQDVTQRRSAEEALRRSEERFRLLVEGVQEYAIFMLDPTGHIASWNAGAQRAKGYTADEVIGQHFSIFYLPEAIERDHPAHELEIAIAEGRYEEEGWRIRKDGTVFWANVVITTIYDADGTHVGFAKVTRDITERRRLLQGLEAAAAERTQFLAVTAHELRNPVGVITGFSTTLDDHWEEFEEAERRQMVSSLRRSGERLGRLVEDLFTAARLESGALEMRTERFDLLELAQEAVADLQEQGITVEGVATPVAADRGRAHQMLSNFLTNAVRYGAVPVRVHTAAVGDMGVLTVQDSGGGVNETLVPRLFDKFAAGGSEEGTGLGLFIVRELARAQGGEAWYEPGAQGATFGLRLPLAI